MSRRFYFKHLGAPICCSVILGASVGQVFAEESDLRGYVAQWVKVKQDLGAEESRWKRDEVVLSDSAQTLKEEIAELEEGIASAVLEISDFDDASKKELEKKAGYEDARQVLADTLPVLESQILKFKTNVPEFALKNNAKLSSALEAIKTSNAENKSNALNGRLADIVNALTELEKLQQTVTLQDEMMELDGEEKKVTVVYFGLATAYAANQSGSVAAIGSIHSEKGWVFTSSPEHAEAIVRLVQVANGEGQVDFTSLPISFQ